MRVCACVRACVHACVRACVCVCMYTWLGVWVFFVVFVCLYDFELFIIHFLTVAANPHTSGVVEIVLVNCMYVVHFLYGQPFSKPKVTLQGRWHVMKGTIDKCPFQVKLAAPF